MIGSDIFILSILRSMADAPRLTPKEEYLLGLFDSGDLQRKEFSQEECNDIPHRRIKFRIDLNEENIDETYHTIRLRFYDLDDTKCENSIKLPPDTEISLQINGLNIITDDDGLLGSVNASKLIRYDREYVTTKNSTKLTLCTQFEYRHSLDIDQVNCGYGSRFRFIKTSRFNIPLHIDSFILGLEFNENPKPYRIKIDVI